MPDADRLVVGRIVKAHGIGGEVAVDVISEAPGRFAPGATLLEGNRTLTVEAARPHQGRLLVKFAEIPDRTAAEGLRGVPLTIPAEAAEPLPEGTWYPHQLEGLQVVDPNGVELGRWVRAEEMPAHDVWVIHAGDHEVMVPAVQALVREVDIEGGRIVIDPPEGLF
ncbi:MAG TPA: ribosome maturation factor RimM [Actinomycetota bacterium]